MTATSNDPTSPNVRPASAGRDGHSNVRKTVDVQTSTGRSENYRLTYRTLRWLMVALAALLLTVSVVTAWLADDWPNSISAYYGGPVRDVFVGVLFAVGACLVAYRGATPLEDFTLNAAGFYALFVALVPTNLNELLGALRDNPVPGGVTTEEYVNFLRVTFAVVLLLCVILAWREIRLSRRTGTLWGGGRWSQGFVVLSVVALAAFLLLAAVRLYAPAVDDVTMKGFQVGSVPLRIHDLAAILLIASLAVAVWSHAWPDRPSVWSSDMPVVSNDGQFEVWYRAIFFFMTFGALAFGAVVAFIFEWDHTIILLEWYEILLFMVFWVLETQRENRIEPMNDVDHSGKDALAPGFS